MAILARASLDTRLFISSLWPILRKKFGTALQQPQSAVAGHLSYVEQK
jgi:hypothetical protein